MPARTPSPVLAYISPFRYPGGKSWFIPIAREWLTNRPNSSRLLIEPFAGGASISLAAVHEDLVRAAIFAERDPDVAATWQAVLNGQSGWLVNQIRKFKLSRKSVTKVLKRPPSTRRLRAFQCILRNRTARGGVLAKGAGLIRLGEKEKGLRSRWYADTLAKRITTIHSHKTKLKFIRGNAFTVIKKFRHRKTVAYFVDPPYTKAARRLYRYWQIDHEQLFKLLSTVKGDVLMTYDDTKEIRRLAGEYGFQVRRIPMRTTHHQNKHELMISRNFAWLKNSHAKRK